MFACMDLALNCKLENPIDKWVKESPGPEELVKHYFPPKDFKYSKALAKRLVNGLKHAAFVRPGIGLQDKCNDVDYIPEPIREVGDSIFIAPTAFWLHAEAEIDRIYAEKDYPFPQKVES